MARFADEGEPPVAPQGTIPEVATTPQIPPMAGSLPNEVGSKPVQPQTVQQTMQTPMPAAGIPNKSVCPGCKAKLDLVNYKRCIIEQGTATSDGLSKMVDYNSNGEENELVVFTCPKCNVVLFADEDDAVDFLDSE